MAEVALREVATLDHLVTVPRGGIGNRVRAIAAARRLCALVDARCTIVWPEGNYFDLLAPGDGVQVVDTVPADARGPWLKLPYFSEGGNEQNRVVPISEGRVVVLQTGFFFRAAEEPWVPEAQIVGDWLPQPAEDVRERVEAFASARYDRTVGMHIRQGDNGRDLVAPPLELFVEEAARLVDEGRSIFLATDSMHAESTMRVRFGARIITWPKSWDLPHRWPRDRFHQLHDTPEIVTDFVDLQLLAACDYVVGWEKSSFSKVAVAYNRSPLCQLIEGPPLDPLGGRYTQNDRLIRARLQQNGDS